MTFSYIISSCLKTPFVCTYYVAISLIQEKYLLVHANKTGVQLESTSLERTSDHVPISITKLITKLSACRIVSLIYSSTKQI